MTHEEAIKILENVLACVPVGDPYGEHEAYQKGIDALKRELALGITEEPTVKS